MNYRFLAFSVIVCSFRVLLGEPEEYFLQKTPFGVNIVDPPFSDESDGSFINTGNSTNPHVQTSQQEMKGSNIDTKISADPVVNVQIHFNEPQPTLTSSILPTTTSVATTEKSTVTTSTTAPKISQTLLIIVTISFVIIILDIFFILCCLCLFLFCKPKAELVPEKDPELGMSKLV